MNLLWPLFNALQWLFLVLWSVFWISVAMLATFVTFSKNISLWLARHAWAPGILWGAGARLKVEPLPDFDWSTPHVFVMNHQSALDIPVAFAVLPVNLRFVAKHTLKYVPFLGWYMWMTGMVFINRSHRAKAVKSLRLAGVRIREGANIIAYPEGTRSKDGRMLSFKKGIFVLALEAGVPVVPVAIEGSNRVMPSTSMRLRPHEVRVKVGQPIPTAGRTPQQKAALMNEVREALIALHQSVGGPPPQPVEPEEERPVRARSVPA